MHNRLKTTIRLATIACVAVLFLVSFLRQTDAAIERNNPLLVVNGCCAPGEPEWEGCGCLPPNNPNNRPPPDYWEQDPPDPGDNGVYNGHPPDKDHIITQDDLLIDLCRMLYNRQCAGTMSEFTMLPVWAEDTNVLFDPREAEAP